MTVNIVSGTSTANNAKAFQVTGSEWTSGTLQWSNKPAADILLEENISHNNKTKYQFSCLEAVKDWYTGSTIGQNENYGIMLRYADETIADYNSFYSADCTDATMRPSMTITYEGNGGGSSFDGATTLRSGEPVDLNTVSANELRYFRFEPTSTAEYIIQSSNFSGDPKVWVYNSNFEQIGMDDDEGEGLNFRLSIALSAGLTYYIAAGHASIETGAFTITVLEPAEIAGGFYRFKNLESDLYIDIHGPDEQTYVHQWTYHSGPQEIWFLQKQSNGYYTIRSQYGDNLYIGVSSANTMSPNVQLFSEISDKTLWNVYITYNGLYIFEPAYAIGKAMCAPNSTNSAEMQLSWMGYSDSYSKWKVLTYGYNDVLTFSALDIGDSEQDEAGLFESYFSNFGYTNIGSYNNVNGYISAQTVKDLGRYSDVIYINGHGGRPACLWVQENGSVNEYVCADIQINPDPNIPRVGIGAQWIDEEYKTTDSYWNLKTKWAILGQCHQLAYQSPYENTEWDGMSNMIWWVRVMLGEGERMHGILGYYEPAPNAEHSYDRLKKFLEVVDTLPIAEAWKNAHSRLLDVDTQWAMLYHSANANDGIDDFTDTTPSGSAFTIYYVRREGGSATITPASTSVESVNGIRFSSAPMFVECADNSVDNILSKLQTKICDDENDVLTIEDNQKITYTNLNCRLGDADMGFTLSDEEAVNTALEMLDDMGIMPEGDYRTNVSTINRYAVDINNNQLSAPETIEYTVSFYRTYNGIDILSDEDDGVVISFDKHGITSMHYKWRDVASVKTDQIMMTDIVSAEQAVDIYLSVVGEENQSGMARCASNETMDTIVRMAYLEIDGEMRPVWVCSPSDGYGNHIFVDMHTGERLSI